MTLDPVIAWSLRLGLALLFLAAAGHKLSDPRSFGATVRSYELLPSSFASPLAWTLPFVETSIALGLLYPPLQQASAIAAGLMLSIYTAAVATNLARGRRGIDCGCFASSAKVPISANLVARNLALVATACALLLPPRVRPLVWVDGLTIATALVAMTLLWAAGQRLARSGPDLRRLGGAR